MSRVRVHNFTISLDGFGTGEGQSLTAPFGHGGHIMDWFKATRSFHAMIGRPGEGETGVDSDFAAAWGNGIGVEIMGRNKFTPERGPWKDADWKGWWGAEPPFHTPCIVLTHFPRPPMQVGETTFHFVDASPAEALAQARAAAAKAGKGKDVRIGGGAVTVREFLAANLIDYLHVAIAPVLLGRGERLWDNLEALEKKFDTVKTTSAPSGVVHVEFARG